MHVCVLVEGAGSYSTDLEMSLVFIYGSVYKGFYKICILTPACSAPACQPQHPQRPLPKHNLVWRRGQLTRFPGNFNGFQQARGRVHFYSSIEPLLPPTELLLARCPSQPHGDYTPVMC